MYVQFMLIYVNLCFKQTYVQKCLHMITTNKCSTSVFN